jgi:PilZ domain-containing protein
MGNGWFSEFNLCLVSRASRLAAQFAPMNAIRPDLFNVCRYSERNWQSGPPSMEEKRKYPRTEISEPAYVSSGGSVMSCVVRNISAEGAAIDVENPAFVPARFQLVMADDSSVYECRIAWIRQKRIGLTFVAMPKGFQDDRE